jgi:type IV fimbrial biogenesis protein FimT
MNRIHPMKRQTGFTLMELLIVIAIAGVLVAVGVPGLRTMVENNRLTSQINQFSSSLALARSEAVKVNDHVAICPSTNGSSCAADVDWNVGWITFINRRHANGAHDTTPGTVQVDNDQVTGDASTDPCRAAQTYDDADDCILSWTEALTPASQTLRSDATEDYIYYNGSGRSNESASFVLCDSRGASHAKAVVISTTGRTSVRKDNVDGSALSCTP